MNASRTLTLLSAAALAACGGPASSPDRVSPIAGSSGSQSTLGSTPVRFKFTTLDDPVYSDVNVLRAINNRGHIVGYYGSGSASDPAVGYIIDPPYLPNNFHKIVFPKALDTFPSALNNAKMMMGYESSSAGKTISYGYTGRIWSTYQEPKAHGPGSSTEIYGVNDSGIAVGCYHGASEKGCFQLTVATDRYKGLDLPGTSAVATGINGAGDLIGYCRQSHRVVGFIRKNGAYTELSYPGSVGTEFLGITAHDYVTGFYVDKSGATHAFLLTDPTHPRLTAWQSLDDPLGLGTTVGTGVNIHKTVVGYYVDVAGVTHGFVAAVESPK
ncbi:MAG: hypothetical protein JOZ77_05365 [Candidatus Eremiobacteraeota bacterium]|nr:hypothetical protein [Candidatus Eremiobacteraeota bacterium]